MHTPTAKSRCFESTSWAPPTVRRRTVSTSRSCFNSAPFPRITIGIKLRVDEDQAVHAAMLDLLRDAFTFGWTVHVDYEIGAGKVNGTLIRVWLTRDRPPVDVVVGDVTRVSRA